MKSGEDKKLEVLTFTLTLTTGALFDQSFKSNFVIYQLYYLEQSILPFFYGTNCRNDVACSK